MHPILARGSRLALYLAVWIFLGLLLAALLAGPGGLAAAQALAISLPLALAYAFFCLSAWYVARSTPIGSTGPVRLIATALTSSIISSAVWLVIARGWLELFTRGSELAPAGVFLVVRPLIFGFGVLLYLLSLAISYLLAAFELSAQAERRGLEAQVHAREAELRSLRAQIDPHFLFNSLHSISALTTADPPAARRMCVLLGDFFRDSLALGAEDRITIARELQLAERFLEIERVRFGDRLRVSVTVPEDGGWLVPPLLLQPLVENAVTHGVAHVLEGGLVAIETSVADARLRIVVANPCDADRPRRTGTGLGLSNVRARLSAVYGDDAGVRSSEAHGLWRVELTLPAERSQVEQSVRGPKPSSERAWAAGSAHSEKNVTDMAKRS
ncbi:MAG: sensor histidine kinase [Vicinamibacterales bacterium]